MADLLEEKTDEMIASTEAKDVAAEQKTMDLFEHEPDTPQEMTTEETVSVIQEGMEQAPSVDDPENIEVAATGPIINYLKKRTREAEVNLGKKLPDEPVQEIGGRLVIKEAAQEDVDAISQALGGQYVKGLNFPQISEQMGEFDLADYTARLKDANEELFEKARRGTVGFDAVLEGVKEKGVNNIVVDMLTRKPGMAANAEEVLGGIIGSYQLIKETDAALIAAKQLPEGADREAAMTRFMQLMSAQGVLLANVSGAVSEAGRTLQVAGVVGKKLELGEIGERAEGITRMFGAESVDDFEHIGELYMSLPDALAKGKFIEQSFGAKTMDVITEVWINSILSAPTTHMVNIAGNSMFMITRTAETALASGIGKLRTLRKGSNPERVKARQAIAQLNGIRKGLGDAFFVAAKSFITEEGTEAATKIDVRNRRAIGTTGDPREIMQEIRNKNTGAAVVSTLGVYARMPGRFLLAEDEFFKGIAYRMTVHEQAEIAAGNLYDELIDAGKSVEEARQMAALEHARILAEPPVSVMKTAKQAAREMTFQNDVDGLLGGLQGIASHPIAKLFVPFYRTPTNIVKQTLARTPLAALSPNIRAQIKAGGRDADIALSKMALGSTIMFGFGFASMGLDDPDERLIIVGKGPKNPKSRQAMQRIGIQPYSLNFKIYNDDGTWTGKYKSMTFSRLDPMSGLLAMSADFAYYAQYEDDSGTLDNLAMAATGGIADYTLSLPFLQGVQELSSIFRSEEKMTEAAFELAAKKLTDAGLSLLPTVSSVTASLERTMEPGEGAAGPVAGSYLLPEGQVLGTDITELPAFMRGFYMSLQKAKARNPFFSDTVEPRLNLWGERMMEGTGAGWEMISPIRIAETKFSAVDQEIMRLGQGIPMPSKKIDGVTLNANQYNKILTYMNKTDARGRQEGEDGFDYSLTLLPILEARILTDQYQALPSREEQREDLMDYIREFKQEAVRRLRNEDTHLDQKIIAVQ
jgi:hypothetical protein